MCDIHICACVMCIHIDIKLNKRSASSPSSLRSHLSSITVVRVSSQNIVVLNLVGIESLFQTLLLQHEPLHVIPASKPAA